MIKSIYKNRYLVKINLIKTDFQNLFFQIKFYLNNNNKKKHKYNLKTKIKNNYKYKNK